MLPTELLARAGGVARTRDLVATCGREAVDAARRSGLIVRTGRGRYALAHADQALRAAHARSGVVSHVSAARWWGWEVKDLPDRPFVTVPSGRKRRAHYNEGARISYRDLDPADVTGPGVTTPLRTVLDCATVLDYAAALAVADSALRHGHVSPDELILAARASPARGRARRRRVSLTADGRAANPFESVLRAHALDAGLDVVPQVPVRLGTTWCRPDLLDESRALALEAESFRWHGDRTQLSRDCHKYNGLTLLGLTLLRFSWEQVMLAPDGVREVLTRARTGVGRWTCAQATYGPEEHRSVGW